MKRYLIFCLISLLIIVGVWSFFYKSTIIIVEIPTSGNISEWYYGISMIPGDNTTQSFVDGESKSNTISIIAGRE